MKVSSSVHFAEGPEVVPDYGYDSQDDESSGSIFIIGGRVKPRDPLQNEQPLHSDADIASCSISNSASSPQGSRRVGPSRGLKRSQGRRSIEEFYGHAHDNFEFDGPYSLIHFLLVRSSYHMLYLALGVVNAGSSASMTCMAYLFASNTNYEEVTQGHEGVVAIANFVGALFGGLLAGPLSDMSGRRKVLLVALALMSIFGVLMAFATAPWNLFICRFLTGFGVGSGLPCVSALVAEHASNKARGFYSNVADAMWTVGFIYGAFLAWMCLEREDRIWATIFSLGIALPNVLGLVMVYFYVPESFRYLAIHGKHEQAAKVANRVAKSLSFKGAPMRPEEVARQYPTVTIQEAPPSLLASLSKSKEAYMELYRIPETRWRVLTAQALWFLIHVGYGVAQWVSRLFQELEIVQNIYLNTLIFAIGAVPGLFLAGVAVEKVSRSMFLQGSLITTLASIALFTILSYLSDSAAAIVIVSAIFHSCLMACWAAVSLVTTEAFSTSKRSAVLGVCTASGMLGVAVMNFFSAVILRAEKPILLLIVGTGSIILTAVATYSGFLQIKEKHEELRDMSTRNLGLGSIISRSIQSVGNSFGSIRRFAGSIRRNSGNVMSGSFRRNSIDTLASLKHPFDSPSHDVKIDSSTVHSTTHSSTNCDFDLDLMAMNRESRHRRPSIQTDLRCIPENNVQGLDSESDSSVASFEVPMHDTSGRKSVQPIPSLEYEYEVEV